MASPQNQYGPPAAYHNAPARQPQAESHPRSDTYSPYRPPPAQWEASNYSSPYRDSEPASPDLHPGIGPGYDSSSSRSQGSYGQQSSGNGSYGPLASSRGPDDPFQNAPPVPRHAVPVGYSSGNRSRDFADQAGYSTPRGPYQNSSHNQSGHASFSSADQLTSGAVPVSGPQSRANGYGYVSSGQGFGTAAHPYRNPYDNHSISRHNFNGLEYVDPDNVADDGDDGLGYRQNKRRSVISLSRQSKGSTSALAGGAVVGGVAGLASATAITGGSGFASKNTSGGDLDRGVYGENMGASGFPEKPVFAASLKEDEAKRRRCKKISFIILGVVILCAIVGGVVAAVLVSKKNDDNRNGNSSAASSGVDPSPGGTLDRNSAQVKALLGNKNLHKVFTGMAYTPLHAQYPDCITVPPIQNNVTLDMAILSQVTNTIRLYGTDCNQTEMVLTAINKLALTDMKVWIGVWLNSNQTTNNRQISQLWSILDQFGTKNIKGVAVGNEVLFRKDLTATQLKTYITGVRSNLTARGISLPVASSDLGDNWTIDLASAVDVIMSNVHPFFGGVQVDQAAAWTWNFWQSHDVALTAGMTSKQHIVSEVGWPSQGGKDCGGSSVCESSTPGAVAGISQLNTFMNTWVCQALTNATDYFWFELLDEPWKIAYNSPGKEWEDHWGLFDVNRNLKPGVVIPSCGGQTVKVGGYP